MWLTETEVAAVLGVSTRRIQHVRLELGPTKDVAERKFYHLESVRRYFKRAYPDQELPKCLWTQKLTVVIMTDLTLSVDRIQRAHDRYHQEVKISTSKVEGYLLVGIYHPRQTWLNPTIFTPSELEILSSYTSIVDASILTNTSLWSICNG